MQITFEINPDEEKNYREAAEITGEDPSQLAKDGAWFRVCDIISDYRKDETRADKTSKIMRFCINCTKRGKDAFVNECAHCKRSPSRVHFCPKNSTCRMSNRPYSGKSLDRKSGIGLRPIYCRKGQP
jgi:hypothetical protein